MHILYHSTDVSMGTFGDSLESGVAVVVFVFFGGVGVG